jgi:MurNAc alpha-1-phosphate uridylyltransferase
MKAIVLAAGRGERMRPLTDHTPKPLLEAGGRSLIEWQILRLVAAGIEEMVINVSHLGERIVAVLGDGHRLGARIRYSPEPVALETAGGIATALRWLGETAFVAVNADIYCEYELAGLREVARRMDATPAGGCAHLVLVPNPEHHPAGDFALAGGRVGRHGVERLTYSGIGVYQPSFFATVVTGQRQPLGPMLHAAADAGRVSGERYAGLWMDIGTPARLERLRSLLAARA